MQSFMVRSTNSGTLIFRTDLRSAMRQGLRRPNTGPLKVDSLLNYMITNENLMPRSAVSREHEQTSTTPPSRRSRGHWVSKRD